MSGAVDLDHLGVTSEDRRRFTAKVKRRDPAQCWEWTAGRWRRGYGQFKVQGHPVQAHRFAWHVEHGGPPTDLMVCHLCDNPPCCNPAHLVLGTRAANAFDMVRKGRQLSAERHPRTAITRQQARRMRLALVAGADVREISRRSWVSISGVYKILRWERYGDQDADLRTHCAELLTNQGSAHHNARLTETDVRLIRSLVESGDSQASVARRFGISSQHVSDIVNGRRWSHLD